MLPVGAIEVVTAEILSALAHGKAIEPLSGRYDNFSLDDAYVVGASIVKVREERGEKPVGRKIGFTNSAIWQGYGISAPIWSYMYDTSVRTLTANTSSFTVQGLCEPRIEPELVLRLSGIPHSGMSNSELLGCIDCVAHGFEIVQSIFPGWRFQAADAVAACGVHVALLLGELHPIWDQASDLQRAFTDFSVELTSDTGVARVGRGGNVLGSPLNALRFLVAQVERSSLAMPLQIGELITTGTLTEAMPIESGQTWETRVEGLDITGLKLRIVAQH